MATDVQLAEVEGKVIHVVRTDRENTTVSFTIFGANSGRKFLATYNGFLPVRVGDAVRGVCEYRKVGQEERLNFRQAPFVMVGTDKDTLIDMFNSSLRGKGWFPNKAEVLYKILAKEGDPITLLHNYALHYCYESLPYDPYTLYSLTIGEPIFIKLCKYVYKSFVLRRLYLLGLTNKEINGSKLNPLKLYDSLLSNPYAITSVPLEKCDNIMQRLGKGIDLTFREVGVITRKIAERNENGWTGVPIFSLEKQFPKLRSLFPILRDEFGVASDLHTVYLPYPYEVETVMAEKIRKMTTDAPYFVIKKFEFLHPSLTEEQKEAVQTCLSNNISILTGPGGAGKSMCIREIISNLEKNGIQYRAASFTGKAVARIREITGKEEPATLHMMIATAKGKKKETFSCLILDEASMITTDLLYEFMKMYDFPFSVILCGDINQIPAISWGNLFGDLIASGVVAASRLTKVHRVDNVKNNGILINSQKIIDFKERGEDEMEPFDFDVTDNFNVMEGNCDDVKQLVSALRTNGVSQDKIAIISPYNRDLDTMNKDCSVIYNGYNPSINDARAKLWRVGDRVMLIENNYSVNLMNGAEGQIVGINVLEGKLSVRFKDSVYDFSTSVVSEDEGEKQLNTATLTLSYAMSIHKTQGSEYEMVIGYVPEGNPTSSFLNANLLYTLITRTKKMIWLIGSVETMLRAAVTPLPWRCSNLAKRIRGKEEKLEEKAEE